MKIKRFFAPDMRQAIRNVRHELGPDAVILSNKKVKGGTEIVAAVDFDEGLLSNFYQKNSETNTQEVDSLTEEVVDKNNSEENQIKKFPYSSSSRQCIKTDQEKKPDKKAVNEIISEIKQHSPPFAWNQEPALLEMQKELKTVRTLLENQLSGFAWGELAKSNPFKVELLYRLAKLGLSTKLCNDIADCEFRGNDIEELWQNALNKLVASIPVNNDDILTEYGVVALVGPTGVGKTTTIAKLAARSAMRHGARQIALISTDNYRIGAHEQLRAYGRILDIPVRMASGEKELAACLEDLSDKRLVLIDTAGMSQRDGRLSEQFAILQGSRVPVRSYVVLSTASRLSIINETICAYKKMKLSGCIFTKIDETTSLGAAMSAVIQHQVPISYISDGQRVPEDLNPARPQTIVNRSVSIMHQNNIYLEDEATNISVRGVAEHANF